ncbi:hypothetical protein KHQ81_14115 [Mycoplasmatota bacterium]|nr:hypothetical protein KHQ81_14115 [Mycoplasmatota bacterium]
MKEFLNTFNFLLKQSLSLSHIINKVKTDKKYRNMLILVIAVLLICIPSYTVFIRTFIKLFETFELLGIQLFLFIVMAIILSILFILFFGMFQIIAYFYFSNDVKVLTPLPIKPSYYLISKFFVIYIWELIFSVFLVLPFFIIYGIYQHIYIYQWVTMSLSFILLPIIPLVIVSILTVLLMSLTNVFKNRDALRMVGYTILVLGLLTIQMFIFKNIIFEGSQDPLEGLKNLVDNISSFLDQFSLYYPVTKLIEYSIHGNLMQAILSVIIYLIISLVFVYLLSKVLQALFIKSYLKEQNNPSRKKKVNRKSISNKQGDGNVGLSIAKIDFITLLKVPIYAFNSLSIIVLLPLLYIIATTVMQSTTDAQQLNRFLSLYNQYKNEFWLAVTLFLIVSSALMPISSTTFSREGKTNWIMRTLPIKPRDHILGRVYTPFFTQLVFNVVMTVLLIITLVQRGSSVLENIGFGLVVILLSLIAGLPLLLMGVYIDLKRPMLKWDNPQQPVKQNMNVIISMGLGIGYGTLLYILYQFVFSLFLPSYMMFIVLLIIGLVLTYITYRILEKQFNKSLVVMD